MKTVLTVGILALIGAVVALLPDSALDQGKQVYAAQKCATCHSIAGVGGDQLALEGVGSKLKPEEIRKWIQTPKAMKADTTMKPYPNLPEKDLGNLVAYLLSLK